MLSVVRAGGALQVRYTADKRSVWVTTKENAPGGVRTEKVGACTPCPQFLCAKAPALLMVIREQVWRSHISEGLHSWRWTVMMCHLPGGPAL